MEKIIQLPFHLPLVAPEALLQVTLETVAVTLEQARIALSKVEIGEFCSAFDRAVLPRIKTPRMGLATCLDSRHPSGISGLAVFTGCVTGAGQTT